MGERLPSSVDPEPTRPKTTPAMRCVAGAAVFYLLASLWSLMPILADPFGLLPMPVSLAESPFEGIVEQDQKLTAATIAFNARALLRSPSKLWDGPQCYPVHRATTLGDHMLGVGWRAAVPALFTESPALLHNFVLLVDRWSAALAMFALVFALTRSFPAALVGGLLFGLHPFRTEDVAHPYAVANQWTPLALLFAWRLMKTARWADAVALTGCVALQVIEGAYPVLALAVFGGTFGLYLVIELVIEDRARLVALLPKMLLFAGVSGCIAWLILRPYGKTGAEWSLPAAEPIALHWLANFAPGHSTFPGFVLSGLAALGAFLRPRKPDRDLRGPFLVAGAVAFLWVLLPTRVPFVGIEIPSLFLVARRFLGFLEMVRAPSACVSAVYVSCAFLAALGVRGLTHGRAPRTRALVTLAVTMAVLLELRCAPLASISFGYPLQMTAISVAPAPRERELYRSVTSGPLLDLPNPDRDSVDWLSTGDYVFAAAYHGQRIGGCYNSRGLMVQEDLAKISDRASGSDALEELHALGFRNLIVRYDKGGLVSREPLPPPARLTGSTPTLALYRLESASESSDSLELLELEPTEVTSRIELRSGSEQSVEFSFRNGGSAVFHHPHPIVPSPMVVRWIDRNGTTSTTEPVEILLPIALAPQGGWARSLTLRVPAGLGRYRVELASAEDPSQVLSRVSVRLRNRPRGAAGSPGSLPEGREP